VKKSCYQINNYEFGTKSLFSAEMGIADGKMWLAGHGKLLANHGRRTNIRGRRSVIKSNNLR
jgi:hypothetical protein